MQAGVRGGLKVAAPLVNIDPQDAAEVVVVDSLAVAVLVIAAALVAEAGSLRAAAAFREAGGDRLLGL